METAQIRKIPEELARRTWAQPTPRPKRLYRLGCDPGWFRTGLATVLANPGSNPPGGDGRMKRPIDSRTDGRRHLVQELHEELRNETSCPHPVNRVYSPKANGKRRPLGLACLRDRAVPATVTLVVEPSYESVCPPLSGGFRPRRSTHHARSALRRGPAAPTLGCKWISEGDSAAGFAEIAQRLRRHVLKKRRQDDHLLDLIPRLLRWGIGEDGRLRYPQTGTVPGSVVSP